MAKRVDSFIIDVVRVLWLLYEDLGLRGNAVRYRNGTKQRRQAIKQGRVDGGAFLLWLLTRFVLLCLMFAIRSSILPRWNPMNPLRNLLTGTIKATTRGSQACQNQGLPLLDWPSICGPLLSRESPQAMVQDFHTHRHCIAPIDNKQNHQTMAAPIIGIDLGTTFSCVACYDTKTQKVEVIESASGRTMPSWVR